MDPFLGQFMLVPYTFAPSGFAFCQGQLLSISQNTALFSLLGTQYGGDGRTTFALPDLRGRAPLSVGQGPGLSIYYPGTQVGSESETLLQTEMPPHTHAFTGLSGSAATASPANAQFGVTGGRGHAGADYVAPGSNVNMSALSLSPAGGAQPHSNMMPYLVMNYVIALQGIFPQRS